MESYSRKTRPLKTTYLLFSPLRIKILMLAVAQHLIKAPSIPRRGWSLCMAVLTWHVWSPCTPVLGSPTRRRRAWRAAGRCSSPMSSAWLGSQRDDDASWGKLSCAGAGDRVVVARANATARPLQGELPSPGSPQGYSPAGAGPLPRPRHPKGKVWGFGR